MAREIVVTADGHESSFRFKAIERSALYGKRRRIPLDDSDEPCTRASLLDDGSLILKSGMTGQGYFLSDGSFLKQSDLEGFDADGKPVARVPSTLGAPQELIGPIDPMEVLDLRITSIYGLQPEVVSETLSGSLIAGDIYRFSFNFRDDFQAEVGILLANDEGIFALIGSPITFAWSTFQSVSELPSIDEDSDDELDFEMF